MASGNRTIEAGGIRIGEGSGLFDTEYGRVLWVESIDEAEIVVQPASEYSVDSPAGWRFIGDEDVITDGTAFSIRRFKQLVDDGRFDVSP